MPGIATERTPQPPAASEASGPGAATSVRDRAGRLLRAPVARRVGKYTAGSVVATVCSELTFLVAYGLFHSGSTVASIVGWLAGAIPNFVLNRNWTWERRGRIRFVREVLPYAAIVLGTVAVASFTTHWAGTLVPEFTGSGTLQTVIVGAVFLATYVVLFAVRFVLLDVLFRGRRRSRHQVDSTTRA